MVEKSFPNTKIAPEQETEEEIKTHIKEIMRELEIIDKIKKGSNNNINYSKLFDYISYHMSYINIEDLRKMSPTFFYELLKNEHLTVSKQDDLLNIIEQFMSTKDDDDFKFGEVTKYDFYELIDYSKLSKDKFKEFIDNFDCMNMTVLLWKNLIQCFYVYHDSVNDETNRKSGGEAKNFENCPNGIISKLFKEANGNPAMKGLIQITGNSANSGNEKNLPNIADSNWKSDYWLS